jgi:hypothetical protein
MMNQTNATPAKPVQPSQPLQKLSKKDLVEGPATVNTHMRA